MSTKLDPKYRPYLTLSEIQYILSKLSEFPNDLEANQICANLNLLIFKANSGKATGSYTPSVRKGIKDKLGFSFQDEEEMRYLNGEMTPEEEIEYSNRVMNLGGK